MKTRYLSVLPWLLIIIVMVASCNRNDVPNGNFESGMDAYARGDFDAAMKTWRPLADKGDPAAQTNMGFLYYEGKGVTRDYKEAVKWYRMAAVTGYPDAAFNMGVAYSEGKGVDRNPDEALRWYRLAADSGYAPAQVILGNNYFRGDGVAVDHQEAANWYMKAAEQGDVVAQFLIANLYISGQGVPQDLVKAYQWLSVAATANHPDAKKNSDRAKQQIAGHMMPAQIAQAEKLAREWIAKKAAKAANQ